MPMSPMLFEDKRNSFILINLFKSIFFTYIQPSGPILLPDKSKKVNLFKNKKSESTETELKGLE